MSAGEADCNPASGETDPPVPVWNPFLGGIRDRECDFIYV